MKAGSDCTRTEGRASLSLAASVSSIPRGILAVNPTDGNKFHLLRYVRSVARGEKTGSCFIYYFFVCVYVFMEA